MSNPTRLLTIHLNMLETGPELMAIKPEGGQNYGYIFRGSNKQAPLQELIAAIPAVLSSAKWTLVNPPPPPVEEPKIPEVTATKREKKNELRPTSK